MDNFASNTLSVINRYVAGEIRFQANAFRLGELRLDRITLGINVSPETLQ